MGAVAVGGAVWPLINQMNPDASTLAAASTEVDLANIAEGQIITVKWRGKPVFVRHRNPKEIQEAQAAPLSELKDPATDASPPSLKIPSARARLAPSLVTSASHSMD